MDAIRILVVSDSHLSSRAPEGLANWSAVVNHVAAVRPDLVVHLGDLTLDGTHDPDELPAARRLLDQLPVPWRAIPGNHDIGDNPWAGMPEGGSVNAGRLARWGDAVGADSWTVDVGGWSLIAINAQLFGSGLDAEIAQWAWLDELFARLPSGRPAAIFSHKPLTAAAAELSAAPPYRFVPPDEGSRLEALFADRRVPLVVNGHAHQFRLLDLGGRRHAWAPTTWATLPESAQPTLGAKRCGVLSITLSDDGATSIELTEPAGIAQLTLIDDIPDPYDRHLGQDRP